MSELPWSKFFWSDWEADQGLRLCSLAAQGLWMRMLCVCAKGDPRGYLAINGQPLDSTGVARLCGIPAEEVEVLMEELSLNGVFSRDRRGWIHSRRMVRDAKKSATGKKFAKKRWSQADEKQEEKLQPNGGPTGGPTTQKPEARSQSIGGGGSARAREAANRTSDPPDEYRARILSAVGVDPVSGLTGHGGARLGTQADMVEARRWVTDLNLVEDQVIAQIVDVMARKRDGPPSSLSFFTKPMARLAAALHGPPLEPETGGKLDRRTAESERVRGVIAGAAAGSSGKDWG